MPNRLERWLNADRQGSVDEEEGLHGKGWRKGVSLARCRERDATPMSWLGRVVKAPLLGALAAYRFAVSPLLGVNCRHLPSCSDYAREAIEKNGAWKGGWLTLARLCRCHPWGSHGFDPVPDLSGAHHPLAPWRYGRWRIRTRDEAPDSG